MTKRAPRLMPAIERHPTEHISWIIAVMMVLLCIALIIVVSGR
jgi:hypothetical protein